MLHGTGDALQVISSDMRMGLEVQFRDGKIIPLSVVASDQLQASSECCLRHCHSVLACVLRMANEGELKTYPRLFQLSKYGCTQARRNGQERRGG